MSGMEVSKADLARIYGCSLPTVASWINRGCPFIAKGGPGKQWIFNTAEVTAWREDQVAQQAVGDLSTLDIEEARRRKMIAEATMMELDLAKRRGEVIEIEEVAAVVADDYANVRAKLLSLPTKMAPMVIGVEDLAECKALLERAVTEALEELTADGIYSSDGSDLEDQGTEEDESKAAA